MSDPSMADAIPPPLDTDDDDVAWALQTAAVQWKRGLYADAVVWLRRAVDAAIQIGNPQRATELNHVAADLTEKMLANAAAVAPPPAPSQNEVDDLLGAPPPPRPPGPPPRRAPRHSIDVEFDDAPPLGRPPPPPRPLSNPFLSPEPIEGAAFPSGVPPQDDAPTMADEGIMEIEPESMEMESSGSDALPRFPSAVDEDEVRYTEQELPRFPSQPDAFEQPTDPSWANSGVRPAPEEPSAEPPHVRPPTYDEPLPPEDMARMTEPAEPPAPEAFPGRGSLPDMVAEGALLTSEPPPAHAREPEAPQPEPIEDEPEARVGEVLLSEVRGLEDLPPESQAELASLAKLERLEAEQEVGAFAVALVVEGSVALMPTVADVPIGRAAAGDVVFTHGTLEEAIALRVVAAEGGAVVALWDKAAWEHVTSDCPWVADELRLVADRFQALAGAAMGELGERFDESLRAAVTDRCEVKALLPGELLVSAGSSVPGMHIIGGGRIELVTGEGGAAEVADELGPGDFLFPQQVLSAGKATHSARAGAGGALVLSTDRMTAHELLVSVPPLIEILAS